LFFMVLEALIPAEKVFQHPYLMLIEAFLIVSAGIIVSLLLFPRSASILSIALVSLGTLPVIHLLFKAEEQREEIKPGKAISFLSRHFNLVKVYGWLFIGMILCYSIWFVALPLDARNSVFVEQNNALNQISEIKANLTGQIVSNEAIGNLCKNNDFASIFECIFFNNATVLGLAILLSFAYGAGAILLIAWNASVIGVVIGQDVLSMIIVYGGTPLSVIPAYLHGLFNAIGFIPHGMPEIIAYFIGAIAGGIISVAITKKKIFTKAFENISADVLVTIIIAYTLLVIAALIETFLILGF
ncbi:MAG: stage II sporulation protein M, partial [archaeon]